MLFRKAVLALAAVSIVGGCATNGAESVARPKSIASGAPERVVLERAQARWKNLLAGEVNRAYEFISPVGRSKLSASDYRLRVNLIHVQNAVAKEATCQAELCDVKISLDYTIEGVKLNRIVSESWILDEGTWWFVYRG